MKELIYSLDSLQTEYKKGKRYDFLFFWGHSPLPDGSISQSCLSQWWMRDFEVSGTRYSCAEQYMMAEKARLFHDEKMLAQIMQATSPKDMKAYGRAVRNFNEKEWETHCFRIVTVANEAKFSQNADLLNYLLGTGDKILVEASPYDQIWGIGMGKDDPNVNNPMRWRGRNLLGFALTKVRDDLLRERE